MPRSSTARAARARIRSTRRHRRRTTASRHASLRPADDGRRSGVRRLRGQHRPARGTSRPAASPPRCRRSTTRDADEHRRPAVQRRRQLGLLRRRMGQRRRQHRRAVATPTGLARPAAIPNSAPATGRRQRPERRLPVLPGQVVSAAPLSVRLLRSLRAGACRTAISRTSRTSCTPPSRCAAVGQLRQAAGHRERASRATPASPMAAITSST